VPELPKNVIKNVYMYSLGTFSQKFEIFKFPAAPETYFTSIFTLEGTNPMFVG